MVENIEDYDSKFLEVENGSSFLSQTDGRFYLVNQLKVTEINEYGYLAAYTLPEPCTAVSRSSSHLFFASRKKIYKLLEDGSFSEKKLRKRILGILAFDSDTPLLVSICKDHKLLQISLNESVICLEKYTDRCDASVLYIGKISESIVLCIYKSKQFVKYAVIGLNGADIILVRKDTLSTLPTVQVCYTLVGGRLYIILHDDVCKILAFEDNLCLFRLLRSFPTDSLPSFRGHLQLINEHIISCANVTDDSIVLQYFDVYSLVVCKEFTVKLDFTLNSLHAVHVSSGTMKLLSENDQSKFVFINVAVNNDSLASLLNYQGDVKYDNVQELEKLIESSSTPITRSLVDYIIENKLTSCAKKCLRSIHMPEIESVRLVKSDISLLNDLIQYTRGSEVEMIKALKEEVDHATFGMFLEQLFTMLDAVDVDQAYFNRRIIGFINILLDAKLLELEQFEDRWVERLNKLVESCQNECQDLHSLLSFTTALLDNKFKYTVNPLMVSYNISL